MRTFKPQWVGFYQRHKLSTGNAIVFETAFQSYKSWEVTIMKLRILFEKQVFVRLSEDHSAFICTTQWPLLSRTRRIGVGEAGHDFALQVREPALRRSALEQGSIHLTAEFEVPVHEL
jgi:hypothetical protein